MAITYEVGLINPLWDNVLNAEVRGWSWRGVIELQILRPER